MLSLVIEVLFLFSIQQEKLQKIVFSSKAFEADSKKTEHLWNACSEAMYSLSPKICQLGLGQQVWHLLLFPFFLIKILCYWVYCSQHFCLSRFSTLCCSKTSTTRIMNVNGTIFSISSWYLHILWVKENCAYWTSIWKNWKYVYWYDVSND